MSDAARRRANWEAKYNVERVKETLDARRADMAARSSPASASRSSTSTNRRRRHRPTRSYGPAGTRSRTTLSLTPTCRPDKPAFDCRG
jgi:hypothetical protein